MLPRYPPVWLAPCSMFEAICGTRSLRIHRYLSSFHTRWARGSSLTDLKRDLQLMSKYCANNVSSGILLLSIHTTYIIGTSVIMILLRKLELRPTYSVSSTAKLHDLWVDLCSSIKLRASIMFRMVSCFATLFHTPDTARYGLL